MNAPQLIEYMVFMMNVKSLINFRQKKI